MSADATETTPLSAVPALCTLREVQPRHFGPNFDPDRASAIIISDKKWVNGTELRYHFLDDPPVAADKKVVRRIKELDPMEVEISLHGARPETHEALTRIKGSFAKTVKALENLAEAGIKVNLKCPITRLNQDELFDVKALADRIGHRVTFDAVITPKDDGNKDPLALRADDAFLEKYWGEWYEKLHDGRLPPKAHGR